MNSFKLGIIIRFLIFCYCFYHGRDAWQLCLFTCHVHIQQQRSLFYMPNLDFSFSYCRYEISFELEILGRLLYSFYFYMFNAATSGSSVCLHVTQVINPRVSRDRHGCTIINLVQLLPKTIVHLMNHRAMNEREYIK